MMLLALLSSLAVHAAPADSLSKVERALAQQAQARSAEAIALLERLVNVNSGTQNLAGVREVGRMLRAEYDALGFTTRWEDGASFGRAGHLIAERTGTGPRVLLIGHLDTVFEPDSPFQRWERLSDSTARGPGSTDMKGGDVIMLYALKALKAAGQLDRMSITVVLNGDEESPGAPIEVARRALVEAGARSQIALVRRRTPRRFSARTSVRGRSTRRRACSPNSARSLAATHCAPSTPAWPLVAPRPRSTAPARAVWRTARATSSPNISWCRVTCA
jgi:glutamate carboxypeptidase